MDLIKISNYLKDASDEALRSALSNPQAQTPSYMVLGEIDRRKKLRASRMNPDTNTSVMEDTMQGLAGLQQRPTGVPMNMRGPQPQMQQAPQGYAGGGEVRKFNGEENSYVAPTTGYGEQWEMYTDPTSGETYPRRVGAGIGPAIGRMFTPGYKKTPEWYAQNTAQQAPTTPVKPAVAPLAAPPVPPVDTQPKPRAAQSGIASVGAPQKAAVSDDYSVNPLLSELKDYRKQMADAYKNQADIYKQQSEEIKNAKSTDVAMALMQAGFGIMGGRDQNAAVNIGQGAAPAVQQYAAADRARREQLQKMAMGQGQLGIEQLGAQMKGVTAEGELGLGGEKMDIARRSAAADEMRARAAAAGVANQASQWKLDNAKNKVDQQRAATLINYLKTDGLNIDEPTKAAYVSEINRLLGVSGTMNTMPQGVTVSRVK